MVDELRHSLWDYKFKIESLEREMKSLKEDSDSIAFDRANLACLHEGCSRLF